MNPKCENCGADLDVNPVETPDIDWVKVVCSMCGNMEDISLVRLSSSAKKK